MRWQKKLTKAELKHVNDWCGGTLAGLKRQLEIDQEHDFQHCCGECRMIGHKLGLVIGPDGQLKKEDNHDETRLHPS